MEPCIYKLTDPKTNEIRYIGYTSKDLIYRLGLHILELGRNNPKNTWIRGLLENGFIPKIECIETVTLDNWAERERYWIAYHLELGHDLLNITPGGKGDGHKATPETRVKLSIAHKGRVVSQATKDKMSASARRFQSPETRQKISDARKGFRFTEEVKAKMSATRKGRPGHSKKLTAEKVLDIKTMLANKITHRAIAEKFQISMDTINSIKTGKTWKTVIL